MVSPKPSEPPAVIPASGTFLHVPPRVEGEPADVVVLGVPYDVATHPYRVGARLGPDHIRAMSAQTRRYLADRDGDPLSALTVVDAGNVAVTPGRPEPAYRAIEAAVREIIDGGAVPLTFGGDGAVTLPQLRAVAAAHPDLVVVHLDAHTDAYPVDPDDPYTNATTFTHAVHEKLLDATPSVHIGTRGTTGVAGVVEYARELGYRVVTMPELRATGIAEVAGEVTGSLTGRPVYLCWDMDVFDPAVAPGVCTPEWGGLTAAEGIEMLRALSGLRTVAVDLNTVSPPHDPAGLTGSLAARMALEFLYSLAAGR